MLLRFGYLIGYQGPADSFINSKNLPSALLQPDVIDDNIAHNLALGRIKQLDHTPTKHFISSPLGLVPKHDESFRKIHHLSYPTAPQLTTTSLQNLQRFLIYPYKVSLPESSTRDDMLYPLKEISEMPFIIFLLHLTSNGY